MSIDGSYYIQKKLEKIFGWEKGLIETKEIFVPTLLMDSFVTKYTKFTSAQQMFVESGFEIDSAEDFKAIPVEEWDTFITGSSDFNSWDEVLQAAVTEYSKR
ncbi:hypothetical protein ACFLZG_01755 [Thermodesulfobacteriota bacterium]